MTEIVFISIFLISVGYVIGKLFKGLNPFKLLFGVSFGFAISVGLVEANNNWYTGLFILGFLLNFANPFKGLLSSFEDYKLHRMYKKSLNEQKSNIEEELHEQVNNASKHYAQKEDNLRKNKEKFEREKADFERQKTNQAKQNTINNIEAMKILDLKANFTASELKKAYKRESMKYHPDRAPGQPDHIKKLMAIKFNEVSSAYKYLEGNL